MYRPQKFPRIRLDPSSRDLYGLYPVKNKKDVEANTKKEIFALVGAGKQFLSSNLLIAIAMCNMNKFYKPRGVIFAMM